MDLSDDGRACRAQDESRLRPPTTRSRRRRTEVRPRRAGSLRGKALDFPISIVSVEGTSLYVASLLSSS
jgi:hypothetical protein